MFQGCSLRFNKLLCTPERSGAGKKKEVDNLRRRYINTGGSSWRRRAWIPALQPQQMCRWVEDTSRLALGCKLQPGGKNEA